jgi:hypothetical protein
MAGDGPGLRFETDSDHRPIHGRVEESNTYALDTSQTSFEGNATWQIGDDAFWSAMERGKSGLLLAGSAAFVIGAPTKAEHPLSPSADPVGAVKAAFKKDHEQPNSSEDALPLSARLSYVWQALMSESLEGSLPRVSGLAIFARTVNSDTVLVQRELESQSCPE